MNLPVAQMHKANTLAIQAIHDLQEVNAALEAQIEDLAPKAEVYDLLTMQGDTIDMTMAAQRIAEALSLPGLGVVNFYKALRAMGIVYKEYDKNYAYQKYVEQGYLKNCTTVKNSRAYPSVRVTLKGLAWIEKRMREWISSENPQALLAAAQGGKQ